MSPTSIYNQQIDNKSAKKVILGFFVVIGVTTLVIGGINTYKNFDLIKSKIETKKPETKPEAKAAAAAFGRMLGLRYG